MEDDVQVNDDERNEAITWMRGVLVSMLEACPLSYQQKKNTGSFLKNMPDWLMARCADSLNIDYAGGSTMYPDMTEYARSNDVRNLARQYLESRDAVAVGNCLEDLSKSIVKYAGERDLPVDTETIERQVYSLALAGCTDEGAEFIKKAEDILSDAKTNNHPVVDYHMVLVSKDSSKIDMLDAALAGGRYGRWAAERFKEVKRWLRGVTEPKIHWEIETLPDVGNIYEFLLKGGKRNES